jgi:hypothetical protein
MLESALKPASFKEAAVVSYTFLHSCNARFHDPLELLTKTLRRGECLAILKPAAWLQAFQLRIEDNSVMLKSSKTLF